MIRTLAIFLASALVACAQWQTTYPVPDKKVVISSGSGAATNITWQNNTYYALDQGTNTVSTFVGTTAAPGIPHLTIANKTNIVIEGKGPESVIFTGQTGTVFCITNCDNVTFRNFSIIGTRGPEAGFNFGGQMAAIEFRGYNRNLTFDGLYIKNHSDQGIAGTLNSDASFLSNCIVKNCYFEQIGCTNGNFGFGLVRDGAAVQVTGQYWTVKDNRFLYNLRDIEFFMFAAQGFTNQFGNKVINNTSFGCKEQAILANSPGLNDCVMDGNTINYDPAMRDPSYGNHTGIVLSDCREVTVINNRIQNSDSAAIIAVVGTAGYESAGGSIIGNKISRSERGMYLVANAAGATNAGWIVKGNTFSFCNAEGLNFNGMNNIIADNIFNRNCIGYANQSAIVGASPGGPTGSNVISGNMFWSDNTSVASSPQYCINIGSGVNYNIIQNNIFGDYTSAPWLDAGVGNIFINNTVGTNLLPFVVRTNTFVTTLGGGTPGGTNFVWNVASGPSQFIEVTNTGLLVITNGTIFNSAQRSRLTLVNNKATNMGVFATVAGVRLLGGDSALLASATAAAHNSLTNGRIMILDCEYIGTNLMVTVNHQR